MLFKMLLIFLFIGKKKKKSGFVERVNERRKWLNVGRILGNWICDNWFYIQLVSFISLDVVLLMETLIQ